MISDDVKIEFKADQFGNMNILVNGEDHTDAVAGLQMNVAAGQHTQILFLMAPGHTEAEIQGGLIQQVPVDNSLDRAVAIIEAMDPAELMGTVLERLQWEAGEDRTIVQGTRDLIVERLNAANEPQGNPQVRGSEHDGHPAGVAGSGEVG